MMRRIDLNQLYLSQSRLLSLLELVSVLDKNEPLGKFWSPTSFTLVRTWDIHKKFVLVCSQDKTGVITHVRTCVLYPPKDTMVWGSRYSTVHGGIPWMGFHCNKKQNKPMIQVLFLYIGIHIGKSRNLWEPNRTKRIRCSLQHIRRDLVDCVGHIARPSLFVRSRHVISPHYFLLRRSTVLVLL